MAKDGKEIKRITISAEGLIEVFSIFSKKFDEKDLDTLDNLENSIIFMSDNLEFEE